MFLKLFKIGVKVRPKNSKWYFSFFEPTQFIKFGNWRQKDQKEKAAHSVVARHKSLNKKGESGLS